MSNIKIKVLEPEIKKNEELVMETVKAMTGLPVIAEVEKVMDPKKINRYDVTTTPGLVINDEVKISGRFPQKNDIKKWLWEEYETARNAG